MARNQGDVPDLGFAFAGWSDAAHRRRMERGWTGGLKGGTRCGSGSARAVWEELLPKIIGLGLRHRISAIADVGAGDCQLTWPGAAIDRYDLVPRYGTVAQFDCSKEVLPRRYDLIVCRHVMIHLDPPRIDATIRNFRDSGSSFLLASTYDPPVTEFNPCWAFNRIDLALRLGPPIEIFYDYLDSKLGLWRLDQ